MSDALLTITGSVTIRERIAIPAGSIVTVKVVDAAGEVLAATALPADGVPVEYSLAVDPAFVESPDRLLVWAALRTEAGLWGTLDLAPAGDDLVVLTRVPD